MSVIVAKSAGFCGGVRRAVSLAEKYAETGGNIYTLGRLIHNNDVIKKLEAIGVKAAENIDDIRDGSTVIIRAHGVGRDVYEALTAKKCEIVDATCPNVEKIHKIVQSESRQGRLIIIIGNRQHPEVIGTTGWCGGKAEVIQDENELADFAENFGNSGNAAVSVVCQTTMKKIFFDICKEILKKTCKDIHFFDTICCATAVRQAEAADLAKKCSLMVVIGDAESANSRHLAEICRKTCANVIFTENADGLKVCNFHKDLNIGITAGASVPDWVIKEVITTMSEEVSNSNSSNENFAELLEQSFKTLNTGEKIVGTITNIAPNEIQVDIGGKHAGFIPVGELSDDPSFKPEEHYKVGDEIEAIVTRVNDMEGVVTLSKKRVDAVKAWDILDEAAANKTVLEGIVTGENRGGVVVSVSGARVFVPASQSGLLRDHPMSELIKSKVRLIITELDKHKKRIVGSIRAVKAQERSAAAEKVWAEIEPGKEYTGTVKSLTSYGAFVDIGGVDGMIHISELSWKHIKNPAEVLSVGQTVNVFVISADKEKKKIALGYRRAEDNPWIKFERDYSVGQIIPVKIVKFMPFGAFAEILPGIDGLIHISQISDKRIARPNDALKLGETVDAKLTEIDLENKRISLSITAALHDGEEASEEAAVETENSAE